MAQTTIVRTESRSDERADAIALVIAWSADEPERVGEVALFKEGGPTLVLGRGEESGDEARVRFVRQRPGVNEVRPPLGGKSISREQLRIALRFGELLVHQVGRCALLAEGKPVTDFATIGPGQTLLLEGQLLLLCVRRPLELAPLRHFPEASVGGFGAPDAFGMVGESAAAWATRDAMAFAAKAGVHALVEGPTGSGKELATRALHSLSTRADGPLIARSAPTLPTALIEAELFGSHAGPGENPGLWGLADGGTLMLDAIGELPRDVQLKLLRALDEGGEHHRIGEAIPRRADVRVVGSTSRQPEAVLEPELLARFTLRVVLTRLEDRREDVPLLTRHLLERAAMRSPDLLARFAEARGARVSASFMEHLVTRAYTADTRELDALLWRAIGESAGKEIALPKAAASPAPAAKTASVALAETHEVAPVSVVAAETPEARATTSAIAMRREGDVWVIEGAGVAVQLKDAKGLGYLDQLLRHPHREFHCADLVAIVEPGSPDDGVPADPENTRGSATDDAGPMLDRKAKDAYRRRVEDLRDQLEEAEQFGDRERASRARAEIEALGQELARAVGLGGRDRKAASTSERARVNVQRCLKGVLARIAEHDAAFARTLAASLKTGTFCSYVPLPSS
jgi:two-component system nitrogen regulation response regulator GlnG/two-component system response regulator HydG